MTDDMQTVQRLADLLIEVAKVHGVVFDESVVPMAKDKIIFGDPKGWEGYVSDVRFTKGVARNAGGYTGHIAGHEFHNGIYVGGK